MKRVFWIPVAVLVLASLACNLLNQTTTSPTRLPPTETQPPAVVEKEPTATTAPVPLKTEAEQTRPPQATPTEAPTGTPAGPVEIVENFDRDQGTWSADFVVTTQTIGIDLLTKGIIQNGVLRFNMMDKETYLYKFYKTPVEGNVSVEADYKAIGHPNNGIAIVCKVNQDQTSWFEVRVSSTSDYSFYLYDKKRKTESGKNPYLLLSTGKLKATELYPLKANTFKVSCQDNEIVLDMNKGMRVIKQPLENNLKGNLVGIGVMSYNVVPVTIEFDKITFRQEK